MLAAFGFSTEFNGLTANCLMNQHFSVSVNGQMHGLFKSFRGLRQGDPLSPALFILADQVLNRGLNSVFQKGMIQYFHKGRDIIPVSHLLFADDTLVLLNWQKNIYG